MKTKTIALGLVLDRIDILLCHGDRIVAGRRVDIAFDADTGAWSETVKGAARQVRAAVAELKGNGLPAFVFYRSPTECSEYAGLNFRSADEAQQAAILACADSLSYPLDVACCQALVLGRDASGSPRQNHVVVAADRDDAIGAMAEMVEEAGLKFRWAAPLDAVIISSFAKMVMQSSEPPIGHLYIGEHRSFFVIGGAGNILFARPISIGINALAASLRRPLRPISGNQTIELDRKSAQAILHEHGFPERNQVVDQERGLTGAQIIPLLQPLLQRFIVELRQSLRFGMPENQRQSVSLMICGPGSAIPGFASVMGDELHLTVNCDPKYAAFDFTKPATGGSEMADAVAQRKPLSVLGLLPQRVAKDRQTNRLTRWLWTGAATALLLIGADAALFNCRLEFARQEAQAAQARTDDVKTLQASGERLFAAISAMNSLETAIQRETSGSINLRACLQELSRLTPESVRLTGISFHHAEGRTNGHVAGYALGTQTSGSRTQLEPFIEQLRHSPLFEKVVLANVQAGVLGDMPGQRFEANFIGVSTPRHAPAIAAAGSKGSTGGATP
ncbi:MAG: hypothetical protein L0Y44_07770 [Phycisphaerales bacterium]|nr:hypothetical protein [Phycisphaerales bacterium]MCI0630534.1 hypothetical protein [Phycisphaerales bacterium]MCI0676463.1 hypothetical protein [Phycisphaerales bacterium]